MSSAFDLHFCNRATVSVNIWRLISTVIYQAVNIKTDEQLTGSQVVQWTECVCLSGSC